ncbi:MAG: transcriptional repressor [Candidatus Eisenbacteria bacterium]|nr:transcriptional repressor [Candidatus Eisenbacteria bacterium]
MNIPAAELSRRLQRFEEATRDAGIKLTHQRREIYRELASTGDHPDAETVLRGVRQRIPEISVDTVYRTLSLLEDLGVVRALGPRRDATRFDANLDAHHHFVCETCGMVRDFDHAEFDALRAPSGLERLGTVSRVCVEVRGLCRECSRTRESRGADDKRGSR